MSRSPCALRTASPLHQGWVSGDSGTEGRPTLARGHGRVAKQAQGRGIGPPIRQMAMPLQEDLACSQCLAQGPQYILGQAAGCFV